MVAMGVGEVTAEAGEVMTEDGVRFCGEGREGREGREGTRSE